VINLVSPPVILVSSCENVLVLDWEFLQPLNFSVPYVQPARCEYVA
jgi:hypothetical protein